MMTHTASTQSATPDAGKALNPEVPGFQQREMKQNKVRRTGAPGEKPNILGGLGGWLWLAVIILPIYYIVITSFRTSEDLRSSNQLLPTTNPTLAPFIRVIQNDFLHYFTNSLIVTLSTVAVVLAVSVMAAYYIARSTTLGGRRLFQVILLGIAIPVQATIIPVYYLIQQLGLYDTLWALILPQIAFAIPLSVLIIVNFVRDIPMELFESMKVDGAGEWKILTALVLPMAKPALMTVGIYQALQVWNGFLFPLVLTQSSDVRVLPLSLWEYSGQFGIDVPATLAAVVLSALPLLVVYMLARRHIVAGLTAGFGK
ncbi:MULTISPECIES: carbohydrate ABC transporter permease [Nesterenkonia]|uniref:Raffinose/stachyose/melibiose transport system permease protein n=3 Tax=Nesterenkonia TaxID=57494 RepID=A0A839FQU3_9MICC|nr:raffinose/stachyose/melibiose transport system permease protein [Nesterenkonia jeotgali]NYJ16512.1 raffinose/stachyose/melibiose transport system permease protein [Nesterenkonia sandarakina]